MTNSEINERLAVLFGFKKEEPWLDGRECWSHKDSPSHVGFEEIPDFAGDLNTVNSAWRKLTPEQKRKYKEILSEVVFRESLGMEYVSLEDLETDVYGITMNASARQRSRALIELLS